MPIHDCTRVDAGIFHHFHQRWIAAIADTLNRNLLPSDFYALAEQHGAGFQPDVLTLKTGSPADEEPAWTDDPSDNGGVKVARPQVRITAESALEFYRRKQNVVAVRHVSGDELVAVVEIVSQANKAGRMAFDDFIHKVSEFIGHKIHLLIIDPQPPTTRDPHGIHGAIWDALAGETYTEPPDKPLTLAAYEATGGIRAYVEPVAVGDSLIDMPLFLKRDRHVPVPLEPTYQTAFDSVPRRWREVFT